VADLVIVGGGFEDLGGQNIIQPLAHGKAVLHGPHMQNFRDVASMAAKAGATRVCATAEELAKAIEDLMADPGTRNEMGKQAKALVSRNLGASARYAKLIAEEAAKAK
jgi:3-deoxy-D-manno-octulosonic-acid transferase